MIAGTDDFLTEYATENRSIRSAHEESAINTNSRAARHQLFTMGQCRKKLAVSVPVIGE